MECGGHHAGGYAGIAVHEFAGGGFVGGGEDDQADGLVEVFMRAAGEDDLAGVGRGFETLEMRAGGGLVGIGPRLLIVKARMGTEDDEKGFLGCGRGFFVGSEGGGGAREGEDEKQE